MSNVIALALFLLLATIPVAAVITSFGDELEGARNALRRIVFFDPRHPALAYDAAADRIAHHG